MKQFVSKQVMFAKQSIKSVLPGLCDISISAIPADHIDAGKEWELFLHLCYSILHLDRRACGVGTEVRVAQHGHHWLIVEELHGASRQLGDVGQDILVWVTVDQHLLG